jgi:hypothetical protein
MKDLEMIQKTAILHCVYQMIASADGSIEEERDRTAIDFALSELGLTSAYSWDTALQQNPHDCFLHVAGLGVSDKQLFRSMMFDIANRGGNVFLRTNCAKHIFQLAHC